MNWDAESRGMYKPTRRAYITKDGAGGRLACKVFEEVVRLAGLPVRVNLKVE
jgi:hypothetical protein